MAYEGLDAPEVAVVAALTHIRSRAWLEQMIARATRIDPDAGPYEDQAAVVFHPDDVLFREFRERIEREQGTLARQKPPRQKRLPLGDDEAGERGRPIVPLSSNAVALRWDRLAPGPDWAEVRPERLLLARQPDLLEPPSRRERELRLRIGRMVAVQAVEDESMMRIARGAGAHHAFSAALKRVMGRARAEMSLAELEATVAWLERNRIADHLQLLEGDGRFAWTARQRRFDLAAGGRRTGRPPSPEKR
jgi:hypothetical protein